MAILKFALKKPCLNVNPCLFLLLTTFFGSCILSHAKITYNEHCGNIVPQSAISGLSHDPSYVFISSGYVSGGKKILGPDLGTSSSSSSSSSPNQSLPGQFEFYNYHIYQTKTPGVFHLTGSLHINGERTPTSEITSYHRTGHWPLGDRFSDDRFMTRFKSVQFSMSGFWSKSDGKLCMVGTGSTWSGKGTTFYSSSQGTNLKPSAVFTLNHPNSSNIYTCIVSGTVESLDASDSPNHFDTVSVLGYAPSNYNYTLIPRVRDICSHAKVPIESLGIETAAFTKHSHRLFPGKFRLEYDSDCSALNCNPFSNKKKNLEFLPTFMTLNRIFSAEDGNVHLHMGFANSSSYVHYNFLIPEMSLVGEGYWDSEKKLLGVLACPVLKTKDSLRDSFVGECTIGISFWFPAVLTIRDTSNVMGRIWSVKGKSNPGYFSPISFQSFGDEIGILPDVKYEYTEVESLREACKSTRVRDLGSERYPDENSIGDLKFDLTVRNANGSTTTGYATPLSFGDNFFGNSLSGISSEVSFSKLDNDINQTLWNVSYMISYSFYSSSLNMDEFTDILAEGVYNSATGTFCMMGCRDLTSSVISNNRKSERSADCEIQINIQLSPLNQYIGEHLNESVSGTRHLNGSIRSTRKSSDPLYFGQLEISTYAMYAEEALDTIRRMDMETIMVVISLSLSCIFVVLQIFYVRKHRDVLPSISITMVVVLTLCHMIPLLLSFESLFIMNGRKKNSVMLWGRGWLEAKEFVMRVLTMVAFLLLSRLLQLAWNARSSKDDRKGLWISEVKSLLFCLPLYLIGGLIAWFSHTRSHKTQGEMLDYFSKRNQSVLKDMISYVGLVFDGFLLPQIVLNIIWNSKDKALAPLFYMGSTAVRAVPHLYDVYRARNYVPYFNFSYIYASPDGDYYSTAWDIIIPLIGVLFAVVIYFQQKFCGSCVLPKIFRKPAGYEAVPAISLESF